MSQPSDHYATNSREHATKGTEVFVGGLPRTISEDKIREVFSSCGEIVEIRLIKDHQGTLKGFCFVHFATKEAADRAVKEKSGTMLDGKKIGVLPSTQQDTLYFGNLNKAWDADEFQQIVFQVFSDVVSVDLVMLKDVQPRQRQRNRGFAFVKFSSHAAASRAQRVALQPDFRLGNLHPAVQWAEEEPQVDQNELSEIKVAFIRSLPADADESFLRQLFEPFGKVEKVVVSKKGSSVVGFVHFTERSDLDRSLKALNEKTVRGPGGALPHKLQVEVARPMDKNKKRARDNSESNPDAQGQSKLLKKEPSIIPFYNRSSLVQRQEIESVDPYEDAVVALPLAVKERLLRILRLGIATRFDIDVKSLRTLKELPESAAITVLDQFMLSGAGLKNKGGYLAGLIYKYLVDKVGGQSLFSLSRIVGSTANDSDAFGFCHQTSSPSVGSLASHALPTVARSDIYAMPNASPLSDYTLPSRTLTGRFAEQGSDVLRAANRALSRPHTLTGRLEQKSDFNISNRHITGPRTLVARAENGSEYLMPRTGRAEEIMCSPLEGTSYGRAGRRLEEPYLPTSSNSYMRHGPSLTTSDATVVTESQAARPQMRFDPFTGEPYKFDPFTGEPIRPESGSRQY